MTGARSERATETLIHALLLGAAVISIVTTLGIVFVLISESLKFFGMVSVWDFITGTTWTPLFKPAHFGVLPLVAGTVLIAGIAILVAAPVGLFTAIFLSEYAPERVRRIIKPMLEVLAGIPTVVYGYFALTFVTPLLQRFLVPGHDHLQRAERGPGHGHHDYPDRVLAVGGRHDRRAAFTARGRVCAGRNEV